jgi:hypothetical protein
MSAIERQQHHVQLWEEAFDVHPHEEYLKRLQEEREKLNRMIARRERFQAIYFPIALAILTIVVCNYFWGPKS